LFIHGHRFTFKHLCWHLITKILRNGPRAHFPFNISINRPAQVFLYVITHTVFVKQNTCSLSTCNIQPSVSIWIQCGVLTLIPPQHLKTPPALGHVFFDNLSLVHHQQEDVLARPRPLNLQPLFLYPLRIHMIIGRCPSSYHYVSYHRHTFSYH
jgi:hypothetical protein